MGVVLATSEAWEVTSEASSDVRGMGGVMGVVFSDVRGLGGAMGVVLATSEDWEG